MYSEYLNSNRYRITKFAFCIFVIVGILNLNLGKGLTTFAEESAPPATPAEAPVEVVASQSSNTEVVTTEEAPEANSEQTIPNTDDSSLSGDASITTGDATSNTTVENSQNTNEVKALGTTTDPVIEEVSGEILDQATTTTDIVVSGENSATTTNQVVGSANTGSNLATSTATSTIVTGDAVSVANVVNEVNTNIINSEGDIFAGNGSLGDSSLDLRVGATSGSSSGCNSCVRDVSIESENVATVTNNVYLAAFTGNNVSSSSNSTISTGDAVAALNVVNVVNTNIVDSNYLLFVFNNIGDWSGDLILPNGEFFANFFRAFNSSCTECFSKVGINNSNSAGVLNLLDVDAKSGENNALGQNVELSTGNAVSVSNVINQVNENVYNDSSFFLVIKVVGNWAGKVFNLPENIGWQQSEDGIILYDKSQNPFINQDNVLSNNALSVENTNSAYVENNIKLEANTGENNSIGDASYLKTGNAFTGSNLVNIVNTNIISSNWIRAMVNIFGDWDGNISFGQPDLWIGTILSADGELGPASTAKFKTTIKNNGDALATKIKLNIFSDSESLKFDGEMQKILDVGDLLPGETKEVEYSGYISPFIGFGSSNINTLSSLSLYETDANTSDNTDNLTILAVNSNGPTVRLPYNSRESSYPDLEIVKTHTLQNSVVVDGKEGAPVGSSVDYKIVVKNNGGSAFEGVLFDQLKDTEGKVINQQFWELGQIFPNETIEITYTTEFNGSTTPGIYTNTAWVEALGGDYTYDRNFAEEVISNIATDSVLIIPKPTAPQEVFGQQMTGEILGAFNQNTLSVLYEEAEPVENGYYLGGMCFDKKQEKRKVSIKETLLYSLSFVLIVRKRKDIPMNLFML